MAGTILYCHPNGSDQSSGKQTAPLLTVTKALQVLGDWAGEIRLEAGEYAGAVDTQRRAAGAKVLVTSVPWQRGKATLNGFDSQGGTDATLKGLRLTGTVQAGSTTFGGPQTRSKSPTERLTVTLCELLAGMRILDGAHDIDVITNAIRGGRFGIQGPGRAFPEQQSHHIRLLGNLLGDFLEDSIQFGCWDYVEIAGNCSEGASPGQTDPTKHADNIQITGRASHVRIYKNSLRFSRTQSLIVQNDLGPVSYIDVLENMLGGGYGVAMQVLGADYVTARKNLLYGSKDGALWLGVGKDAHVPVGTIAEENVMRCEAANPFRVSGGATYTTAAGHENILLPA